MPNQIIINAHEQGITTTDTPNVVITLNQLGYTPTLHPATDAPADVIDSALAASMFGWDTPIASAAIAFMGAE